MRDSVSQRSCQLVKQLGQDWLREAGRGAAKEGAQGVGLTLQLAQLRLGAAAGSSRAASFPRPFPRPGRG